MLEKIKEKIQTRIFKIVQKRFEKEPKCFMCNGRGWLIKPRKIDNITFSEDHVTCNVCEQYGVWPLSWFTRFLIRLIPDE